MGVADIIWDATRVQRHNEETVRRKAPLVRIWDGEYHLQHVLGNEYKAQFSFVSNDTGPGQIEIPFDSPVAKWIHDHQGRVARGEGRNVMVTVDHCGARWSGIMDKYAIEQRKDGDVVLVMDLMHDYEFLKWYQIWSNPSLPAFFQVPRAFLLCVRGDTLIDGPDGKERIDVLAEHGQPFRVWSITPDGTKTEATASHAFRKGHGEVFTYSLSDGHSITVTKNHRFLTPTGFKKAGSLKIGSEVCVLDETSHGHKTSLEYVSDEDYAGIKTTTAFVDKITSAGFDDFYDLTVPGWNNYCGNGIWNHNCGPVTWVLKTALFMNLLREHNPLQNNLFIPDDPLDKGNGFFDDLDQSNWSVVIKPQSFGEAMASGVVWGVLISRWATWHDAAHAMLEDAELSVRCERYLEGDDPPWEGADLRYGTLIIDIVDKSGINVGTSTGGNIFTGLRRTVVEFADDFIDSTAQLIQDVETPQDYFKPGSKFTAKEKPYVLYQEGDNSAIESSAWFNSPAKGVRVSVGGHSMPGVNEVISASIQGLADLVGTLVLVGNLGSSVDQILKPLYEDTIAAWWSIRSPQRNSNSGWARLHEYFQTGSDRAYTISSLMVIRAGFWSTKTQISWKVEVSDGRPFTIGDNGIGHFFLDDRVGLRLKGDDEIHMDRCRKIDLAWNPDSPPEWQITIGDDRVFMDPAQRAWGKIERLIAGLRDLGVY